MRKLLVAISLTFLPLAAAEDPFLAWMDHVAQGQLDARDAALARIQDRAAAEARQAAVRAKILQLIGGLPDYDGPLNARVTGRIERPRYTIENVIFESLPGYYVSANLYRPNQPGRHPGVLFPLGHWDEGKPAAQRIAANLAMKGFVVLAYDPVGQGERQQAYDARLRASLAGGSTEQHFLAGAQAILAGENFARYRIWDAKRALDYLVSRPEVETEKIGCTGCSGGGTLTAYISALDGRIKVAAPACYINTWRKLFTGPTGDSEQSFPNFLAAGLDVLDYIELFAPKPYLVINTVDDFFPIEGARHAYQEALGWYRLFGAGDRIRWAIGPGGHGTPREVREELYRWMIQWLEDGHGNPREEPVEMAPDFELQASATGQVGGKQMYEVIRDGAARRFQHGSREQLLAQLRQWSEELPEGAPRVRVLEQRPGVEYETERLAIAAEPGLEIGGTLYTPNAAGPHQGVLLVNLGEATAARLAGQGAVVLDLLPRGVPEPVTRQFSGDWLPNTRAWLIGRNLPGLRAADIRRGASVLLARPEVARGPVRAAARGVAGIWLLMAAALDTRLGALWLDRTPYSLRAALDEPLSRNLHDAVLPGFVLHWDLADLAEAIAPRRVVWSDPTDWMGIVVPHRPDAVYRTFDEDDSRFLGMLAAGL